MFKSHGQHILLYFSDGFFFFFMTAPGPNPFSVYATFLLCSTEKKKVIQVWKNRVSIYNYYNY